MAYLDELFDISRKIVFLVVVFGGTLGALTLLKWVSTGAPRRLPQGKKKRATFTDGGGQRLGRASSDKAAINAARMARISNNRFQKMATLAKENKRVPKRPQPTPAALATPAKSNQPSGRTSPRSVVQDISVIPEELQSESTKHFFVDGITKFIAVPSSCLHDSDDAVAILRQLAQEFMPIIRKHGFNIRSVSEMCCCADGLEYELGGERRSVPAGETIVGNDHESVAGYNGKLINRFGHKEHVIHLRLRKAEDHHSFMEYDEIVDTMAHELSHCVHEDHGPEFWDLMEEIMEERKKIVKDLKNGIEKPLDPVATSKEQFKGFNIYSSVSGQLRNWNGQVNHHKLA